MAGSVVSNSNSSFISSSRVRPRERDDLVKALKRLRDAIAEQATGDLTVFANAAISKWSRMISLSGPVSFRRTQMPMS